jgi:hypothetical protein
MRSIKLVPALAATATLLALVAAGASARPAGHKHASPNGSCRINIEVAPRVITTGEPTTVFGHLTCPGAAGQPVTIYQHSVGTPGFSVAGTPKTEASGSYQLTTAPLLTNSVFYAVALGAQSGRKMVKVAPKVTLNGPPDGSQFFTPSARPGSRARNAVTFTGTVSPANAGARVVLQRENATANEEWRRIDLGTVNREGTFAIKHVFVVPGDANIRVVVRPRTRNVPGASLNIPGASLPFSYEISQPQNPSLTIQSSAEPIPYGQSVTISGTVAGAVSQPVTLLARPHTPGAKLTPVAQATTNATGGYVFVQKPLLNTQYRVTSGAQSSAVLFEGVKYAITGAPSATTIQAGQPLTYSGTVAPALAGHPVYLERKFPSNVGFAIVDVGTVTAAGTYSIVHTFFNPNESVVRAAIPGDPNNQGKASEPVTIKVTPAPASALRPEAPSNAKLPGEGQV